MAFRSKICFAISVLAFLSQCLLTKCSVQLAQSLENFNEEDEVIERSSYVENDVYSDETLFVPIAKAINQGDSENDESIQKANVEQLQNSTHKRDILIISTLDGMVTALDSEDNGEVLWQLQTGPGSLLSSSISKVELNSDGKLVRLIPSLSGGLYKFDGEGVEPIQLSADSLLHSSYLAADDLLITGGKEIRTYGVDATTGHLQYTCTASGCHIKPIETTSGGELLIIRRHSQVVRAIEPRSGMERWNFSVGRHEATILQSDMEAHLQTINQKPNECFPVSETSMEDDLEIDPADNFSIKFKITVPDGVINAFFSKTPQNHLWRRQFDSPIAQVWHLKDGKLAVLDTFDMDNAPAREPSLLDSDSSSSNPLLYVGLHNHQLYVQESSRLYDRVSQLNSASNGEKSLAIQKKFYLHPTNKNELLPVHDSLTEKFISLITGPSPIPLLTSDENTDNCPKGSQEMTALTVQKGTGGLYLYEKQGVPSEVPSDSNNSTEQTTPPEPEEEELWEGGRGTTVHVVVVSLWFWWREVVFISLITALVFHVFITRQVIRVLQHRWFIEFHKRKSAINLLALSDRKSSSNPQTIVAVEDLTDQEAPNAIQESHEIPSSTVGTVAVPYVSRYLTDFEPIQCLGKGGFGLVFEVRNRLDDCHYAVKRIQLPNTEAAREKVMREVKALAKLDNPHIVRYFHAWIECPPPGWQESQDALLIDSCESITGPTPCNTGEESSYAESKSTALRSNSFGDFSSGRVPGFPKLLKSIDNAKRDLTSMDDSLDIVFENSEEDNSSCADESSHGNAANFTLSDLSSSKQSSESNEDVSERENGSLSSIKSLSKPTKKAKSGHKKRQGRDSSKESRMYLYIQMQLCRKESLREWLRAQVAERDINHVLHVFNDIVRAVEYVHLQGLIHRDLKPSNIFFAPDGSIKIGDFGLVTAMAEEANMLSALANEGHSKRGCSPAMITHTDQVGTQLYMSPEQIEGKPYSYKVDIYSLGLILFELLWPLGTQMEQVVLLSRLRDLNLPSGFNEKFSEEGKLLCKMLARNPDERPTTFGIRASPPLLKYQDVTLNPIPEHLHYNLQRPRRTTE